jgi:hypothetical protein
LPTASLATTGTPSASASLTTVGMPSRDPSLAMTLGATRTLAPSM